MKKNKEEKEEECGGSGEEAVGRNVKKWMEKGRVEKRRGGGGGGAGIHALKKVHVHV